MKVHNKYIGKVIDNNHESQNGLCQIYIEPLHHDLNQDQYPWFKMDRESSSNIPEINDYVWCWFIDERYHKQGYYGNKLTLLEYHEHNQTIGSITTAYPDVKYWKFANGAAIAFSSNSDTPEISIYHPSGSEIFMNSDGEVYIKGSSGTLEYSLLGETVKQFLSDFLDGILALTVGTGTGPSSTPINASTFTTLKSNLTTLLSTKVKNN